MTAVNARLWRYFDERHASAALVGADQFFIPDPTFRESHDRLLVLHQLQLWAEDHGAQAEAERAVVDAIESLLKKSSIGEAIDAIWSVIILEKEYRVAPPVSRDRLRELARQVVEVSGYPRMDDAQAKTVLQAVLDALEE